MKRILHISKYYFPYAGGIEDVCYNIVRIIKENSDHKQKVICFNDGKDTLYDKWDEIEILRAGVFTTVASQAISYKYYSLLRKILNDFKPDIVHFHAPNPFVSFLLISLLPKETKLIVHWHSDIVVNQKIYKLVKPSEKALLKRANVVLATSPNYIESSVPLLKFKDKVQVLQNIITTQKFERTPKIEELIKQIKSRHNNKPIILFVGRHVTYKGIENLISASVLINGDFEIAIAGKGPLTKSLTEKNRLENVTFIGRVEEEELIAYFWEAAIFAFPSITKNEAFGVALAEAMYCHTPAVTFTIEGSGVNWVNINGETGIEVENSNTQQLADAITLLLKDSQLREQYGENAHDRVMKLFTKDVILNNVLNLYK